MKETKYPRSFSHIGITVPDIEKAVTFYSEVMGWYVIMKPSKVQKEIDDLEKLKKEYSKTAEENLKLEFILDEIKNDLKIKATEKKINDFLNSLGSEEAISQIKNLESFSTRFHQK